LFYPWISCRHQETGFIIKEKTIKNDKKNCDLFTDELARTVLNSLSAHIAILNQDGVIVETKIIGDILDLKVLSIDCLDKKKC